MLTVAVAVTGCSPIRDGKVGITRDLSGRLVGLAKACEGEYDGAVILQDDDPTGQTMASLARWSRPDATGDLLTWGLEDGTPSAWATGRPLTSTALTAGHAYVMDAVGDTQKWSADELRFTVADLKTVTADTVLVPSSDPKTGQSRPALIPRDQFTASACGDDTQ
jgi:hypothetical protein